jgi:hypothetical protein
VMPKGSFAIRSGVVAFISSSRFRRLASTTIIAPT